ncbi:MAG: HD domain-containing protein [Peptococcaceae bacterium]|nr:HD domain-containing protein [Peptococcaceae bacterium]
MALYSEKIAGVLCPDLMNKVVFAASIHDLGKICIPDNILLKPASLNKREIWLIRLHPLFGVQILKRSIAGQAGREVSEAVMHHHERWDGLGYPNGLKGKGIPFVARVLAVADAFDAMTSFRPYRVSLGMQEAFEELQRHSGTQFDPEVVFTFLEVMRESRDHMERMRVTGAMTDVFEQVKKFVREKNIKEIFALLAETEEPAVREEALVQAVRLGGPEVVESFISLLSSPEAHLRNLAVEALQELGAGYIDRLEKLLYDPDPDLKILCFNVLAGVRSEAAAGPVRRFLERLAAGEVEIQQNVVAAAVECLGGLGGQDDAELLDKVAGTIARYGVYPYLRYVIELVRKSL